MAFSIAQTCILLMASLVTASQRNEDGKALLSDSFSRGEILRLNIHLDEVSLAQLRLHPRAYVRGMVVTEGRGRRSEDGDQRSDNELTNLGIHLKGNYGTFQAFEKKPSLTLNFDKFVTGQKFHG